VDISKIRKKIKDLSENQPELKPEKPEAKPVPVSESAEKGIEEETTGIQAGTIQKTESKKSDTIAGTDEAETEILPVNELELLAFNVASEEYAVKLADMQEIIRSQTVTPIPRSPEYLSGATFLRGKILPVVDLGKRLGLKSESGTHQKIIVISASKAPIGILILADIDVLRCREDQILPPPSTLDESQIGLIEGVVNMNNRFMSLLNIDNILRVDK